MRTASPFQQPTSSTPDDQRWLDAEAITLPLMRPHETQNDVRSCSRCTWRMRRKARLWLTGFDA
jgi:hypothetical protein